MRMLVLATVAVPRVCAGALDAAVAIDYAAEGHAVSPMAYGGNLHYQWHSVFQRDRDALTAIAGHSWRVHWWDNVRDGYRWDTHTIEPDGEIADWHKLDFEENSDGRWYVQSPNTLAVEYWNNATDFGHSLAVTKTAAASNAYVSIRGVSHTLPVFLRFDLKIDGDVPFAATGAWYVADANGSTTDFRLRLTNNRAIAAIFYDKNQSSFTITSAQLSTGTWHSVEVQYGDGAGALWIDHAVAGSVALDLSGKTVTDLYFGSHDSATSGVQGRIFIDAVRLSSSYVGADVQPPWNDDLTATPRYLEYLTFDGNMMTVDDICRLAEEIGVTVIFQIPLSVEPSYGGQSPPYSWQWDTIQYWADFVEYVNGTADPDYAAKSFDWTHAAPSDNWANLRAQRGRVEPYSLEYVEVGNEPYYQGWNWNPPGSFTHYAQKWADTVHALKEVDPGIRCGLPGREEWGLWDAVLPEILDRYQGEELIDWLAVHQYSRLLGHDDADQLAWWLGAPAAKRWEGRPDELAGQPWLHSPEDAQAAIDGYLSGRGNYSSIFVALTEYNYPISFQPYGSYRHLIDAICKAGFIGGAIEHGARAAHVFTLDTEQRHEFGLIGDPDSRVVGRELTPSYHVYRLWGEHFGSRLVAATVDCPTPLYDVSFGSNPTWENYRVPYLSVWASKNEANDTLYLMAINRHQAEEVAATITVSNFTPAGTADVYTVGGAGFTVWSDNASDPENVTISSSQIEGLSHSFSYSFEPLSVTALVLPGSTQPTFPVRVNYGPSSSDLPGGYLRDGGEGFGPKGAHRYGWR